VFVSCAIIAPTTARCPDFIAASIGILKHKIALHIAATQQMDLLLPSRTQVN
jgi:hypothetical protein